MGKIIAEHFLTQNDFVYGCSRRNTSIVHANYRHFNLNISDEAAVQSMIREIYLEHKKIDVLINNAGMASMNHFLLTSYSTTQKLFETNFYGTFLLCREVSKIMARREFGRIVNFSTVAVPLNLEGELIYSASKAAVEQLTRVLAMELGRNNITVNAVGPTPVQTDLIANVPSDKISALIDKQSINRMGEIEDVLNVIEFLVSEKSDFITGQIIYLGGVN